MSSTDEIIKEYEAAKAAQKRATRIISLLLVVIATVNVGIIILDGKHFLEEESPQVAAELAAYIQPVASKHGPQIEKSLKKVLPAYVKVFQRLAAKEGPVTERKLKAVLTNIEEKAKAEWPKIQAQVNAMVDSREEDFRRNLEKALGREVPAEELDGIMGKFKVALAQKTHEVWLASFMDHKMIVDKIENTIKQMHKQEPDLNRHINLYEASGILLEFAGVEMQKAKL